MIVQLDLYKHLTADLGEGLTEGELYFWSALKKIENMPHRKAGHTMCARCDNCLDGDARWRCLCGIGRKYVTPYRIRPGNTNEKYILENNLIYVVGEGIYVPKNVH